VWWAFKELHTKGLVEEGFKVMQLCPRCGTTLSNFEVSQGYKDIKDLTAVVKFELEDEPGTYVLAWTTTPWTLAGNVALAVGTDFDYVKIAKLRAIDNWNERENNVEAYFFISKKIFLSKTTEEDGIHTWVQNHTLVGDFQIIEEIKGSELVGLTYKPVFSGVVDTLVQGKERDKLGAAFRIYAADFVTTDEGTGVVHMAPAYGEEDLGLAREHGLPVVHHVDRDGKMDSAVPVVAGKSAKPKGNWKETDGLIVEYLGDKIFLAEEKEHSYPHCWRCDTPLLNYASSSWFVLVSKLRNRLVEENKKINWVPQAIGQNRFGDWLKNARDWSISRSRYWGAPIPVWKNERTGELRIMSSIDDLKKFAKRSGNTYFVMRHGEATHNLLGVANGDAGVDYPLTEKGRQEAYTAARSLAHKKIVRIYASPLPRGRQTAECVADGLGLAKESIVYDDRLREFNFGELDGKPIQQFVEHRNTHDYGEPVPGGESYQDVKNRFGTFLYELERTHADENILIVTHGVAFEAFEAIRTGANASESKQHALSMDVVCGQVVELDFNPLPHNANFELDLHRPYIDDYALVDSDGGALHRVPDVFDCWFESGSMSYAQDHYPFSKERFNPKVGFLQKGKGFPADFIAEGLDQTRGWFYSLLVLGVALFGRATYKQVIVNGLILAEDGRKMSKSLKNYPEPMDIVEKYGADALRLYLLSSSLMRSEDLRFSERGVSDVGNKVLGRLHNMLVFYSDYALKDAPEQVQSTHILDRWVLERLRETHAGVTEGLERYEIDRAARSLAECIDDISTWYLRRSRERLKDDAAAASTLRYVLRTLSLLLAPFTPFYAEYLFRRVKYGADAESVHLMDWPESPQASLGTSGKGLVSDMALVRALASEALKKRQEIGSKVRQPLSLLSVPTLPSTPELVEILKEEVNVKEVRGGVESLTLDAVLTPELVREGDVREFMRALADARKAQGLSPSDFITVSVRSTGESTLTGTALPGVSSISFTLSEEVSTNAELSFGRVDFMFTVDAT